MKKVNVLVVSIEVNGYDLGIKDFKGVYENLKSAKIARKREIDKLEKVYKNNIISRHEGNRDCWIEIETESGNNYEYHYGIRLHEVLEIED